MIDEFDKDEDKEAEEEFDPAKIKEILSEDPLDEPDTLDEFESDMPVTDEEEEGGYSLYSGEEDISQFSY